MFGLLHRSGTRLMVDAIVMFQKKVEFIWDSEISRRLALTVYSVVTVTLSMHVREGYLTGLLRLAITVFFLLLVVCLDRRMIQLTTNRPLNTCRRSGLGLPALARHLGLYVCYVGCAWRIWPHYNSLITNLSNPCIIDVFLRIWLTHKLLLFGLHIISQPNFHESYFNSFFPKFVCHNL